MKQSLKAAQLQASSSNCTSHLEPRFLHREAKSSVGEVRQEKRIAWTSAHKNYSLISPFHAACDTRRSFFRWREKQ